MVGSELDRDEKWEEMVNLHTTAQIEERFQKVFKREMTPEERHCFFMPNDEYKKSPS
jgi:Trp operon repressor